MSIHKRIWSARLVAQRLYY